MSAAPRANLPLRATWGGDSWVSQNALLMAVVWPLLIFALFFPLSVRRYRRLSR